MMHFIENHNPIFETQVIIDKLAGINDELHSAGFHFKVDVPDEIGYTSYPNEEIPENTVIVIGSFDFTYYHQCEFAFHQVKAHKLPDYDWRDHWEKPQLILLAGNDKIFALQSLSINDEPGLQVFAFNLGSFGDNCAYLACNAISIFVGTTFYYNRVKDTPLDVGERMAWWVQR